MAQIISIRQPWVWAILELGKPIENRSRATNYRGEIYLHASQTYDREGQWWLENTFKIAVPDGKIMKKKGMLGSILGKANLVDISPSDSIWAMPNSFHLHLADVRPTHRYELRGQIMVPFSAHVPEWIDERQGEIVKPTHTIEEVTQRKS